MAGSWQSYVDDQLVGTGHITNAVIIGRDGAVWAASPGFGLKPGEAAAILKLYGNPSDVFRTGVTVNGVNYRGIKADERSIYGKTGENGAVLVRTGQSILIGVYDGRSQPGNAAWAVEKLGDYLINNGY